MQSIDEWIARQDVKLDRPEAIRRLVEIGDEAHHAFARLGAGGFAEERKALVKPLNLGFGFKKMFLEALAQAV